MLTYSEGVPGPSQDRTWAPAPASDADVIPWPNPSLWVKGDVAATLHSCSSRTVVVSGDCGCCFQGSQPFSPALQDKCHATSLEHMCFRLSPLPETMPVTSTATCLFCKLVLVGASAAFFRAVAAMRQSQGRASAFFIAAGPLGHLEKSNG